MTFSFLSTSVVAAKTGAAAATRSKPAPIHLDVRCIRTPNSLSAKLIVAGSAIHALFKIGAVILSWRRHVRPQEHRRTHKSMMPRIAAGHLIYCHGILDWHCVEEVG
jgi:hypothetical protein